jgi:hypothetical protein
MLDHSLDMTRWDRSLDAWRGWAARLPECDAGGNIRTLWSRVELRLRELAPNLDRVLVVGLLGGTGTGKSTLLNAIIGERVCRAGDVERPTTKQPTVVRHPTVDVAFLPLDAWEARVINHELPLLEHMILIDCPDPDTQGPDTLGSKGEANTNLDRLRTILPHCDVIVVTGTAQKYKTQRVWQELQHVATGRAILFVQTHAQYDADIRDDWRRVLEKEGFARPTLLRLDSEQALRAIEQRLPVPPEYTELRALLERELHARGRMRLRRANALNLWSEYAHRADEELSKTWSKVELLDAAISRESARLLQTAKSSLQEQLAGEQTAWRRRLLGECAERWGMWPFGVWLRVTTQLWSWIRWLPIMRARSLGTLVVAGAYTAGQTLLESFNSAAEQRPGLMSSSSLGWTAGELAQTQSIISGFLSDAGLQGPDDYDSRRESVRQTQLAEMIAATQASLQEELDLRAREQATRQTRWYRQMLYEIPFTALIALLFGRWGYDFFYRYLWQGSVPTSWDVVLQGFLWIAVLGWLLRMALAASLGRGWERVAKDVINQLDATRLGKPLFSEIHQQIDSFERSRHEFDRLQSDLDTWNSEQDYGPPSQLSHRTPTLSEARP